MNASTRAFNAEVAVIGAGLFGIATAYYLSKLRVSTIVVDGGDLGAGASGANAGNLHLQISPSSHATETDAWLAHYAQTRPFFITAVELWKTLAGELPDDIELRCPGGLMVAETPKQMQSLENKVALERENGLDVCMWNRKELQRCAPYLADHLVGGSFCPGEGMANALTAVTAMADVARDAGTRFIFNDRVQTLQERGNGWRLVTRNATIDCERVVIAGGSTSATIAAMAGLHIPLTHRTIQMVASEACERFVDHLVYHCDERLTLKQVANGNVLIGGGWTAERDDVFSHPSTLRDSIQGSLVLARRIVPALSGVSIIRSWAGPNVYTPNGRPMLGEIPDRPGLFVAICNTYGFTLGPLCGKLVAAAVTDQMSNAEATLFSNCRPDVT